VQSRHDEFLRTRRFASLDGLRFLAIVPVIWHHSTPRPLDGIWGKGPLGVHLFFAISGFLITTLLLRERASEGGLGLGGFYARRALRIFPLYYLTLGLYALRAWLFLPDSARRAHFFASLPYYATYTGNWFVDYGVSHPVIFGFSWSLATEEQFYLVWPWLLLLSRGWRLPLIVLVALLGIDFAAEHGMLASVLGSGAPLAIVTSISAPICLGSLLALGLHHRRSADALALLLARRASAPLALFVLIVLIALDAPLLSIHLAMTALVGAVCVRPDHGLARPLELRAVSYVGLVSYGLYLFHVSAITLVKTLLPGAGAFWVFVSASAVSLAMAAASFRWLERPFLRLKDRFGVRQEPAVEPQAIGQYAAS
jgi:peptidoglycan/LPS O-acetylase OafA/YrhL